MSLTYVTCVNSRMLVQASITALVDATGPFSRAFVRASGTENVCRVYAETPDATEAQILAEKVKGVVVEFAQPDSKVPL